MLIGEIVVTEHLLDIGLQVGYGEYGPKIRAVYSKYSPNAYYGGAQFVKWIGTGKYISEDDWNHHTDSSMSVQKVLDIYQIDISKVKGLIYEDGGEKMTVDEIYKYDEVVSKGFASKQELDLIHEVFNCTWDDTINYIVWFHTGYLTFDDYVKHKDERKNTFKAMCEKLGEFYNNFKKLQSNIENLNSGFSNVKNKNDNGGWNEIKRGERGLMNINLPSSQEVVIINKRDDRGDNVNYDVVTGWFTGKFDGNEPIFVSGDEVLSYVRFWKPLPKPFVY